MNTRAHQAGFSLMELMIGMVLGLIVVSGAVGVYLASSRSYSQVEQAGELNENSRFTEQVLTDALRHVGFMGEAGASNVEDPSAALPAIATDCNGRQESQIYRIDTPLYAVSATETASAPDINCFGTTIDDNALDETEILIMKSAVPSEVADINNLGGVSLAGKLWLLTNESVGMMFDGDATLPSIAIGGDVPSGSAWEYRYEVYFIHDFRNADGKLMPSLSRFVLREAGVGGVMELVREELVPGVEDMRMRFGLDTAGDGNVDLYSTVAEVEAAAAWPQIVSIEIALLVSGSDEDPNYTDANAYTLAGTEVLPPPTRLQHRRAVVRANVSLRNIKFLIRGPT